MLHVLKNVLVNGSKAFAIKAEALHSVPGPKVVRNEQPPSKSSLTSTLALRSLHTPRASQKINKCDIVYIFVTWL